MKDFENKDNFLECILKSYFNRYDCLRALINFEIIELAANKLLNYYRMYDSLHKTNHISTITKLFITQELNNDNCRKLGYCKSTFYRYRKAYLNLFSLYLNQLIQIENF